MQFGKVYVDPKAGLSEKEFMAIVRGQNIGGIDRRDAWEKYKKEIPKKAKEPKEEKPFEFPNE
jgi:uncharacterized protein YifE (UPF0438 family)